MNILIIAEHDNKVLNPSTISAVCAAQQLSTQITVLILGYKCTAVLNEASLLYSVTRVLYLDDIIYQDLYAEQVAEIILQIISKDTDNYRYIICAATSFGKEIMPRIAACLDVEQISEIIKIIDHNTFERFIYSGDAIETVQLFCAIKCLTIRVGCFFNKIIAIDNISQASIEEINNIGTNNINILNQIKRLKYINNNTSLNLSNAKIVVAGGRALQSKDNFVLIERLAKKLNAAVGATRTAVYAGFAPYESQIGLSGNIIAPDLYIAIGISGAVQHICGIKDSKVIVAINSDQDAPIFKLATYKIVGDLFKIVPELIDSL